MLIEEFESDIFRLQAGDIPTFDSMARRVQSFQRANSQVYARFGLDYLPVSAFKHAAVTTFTPKMAEAVFQSSRTGQSAVSRHYVRRLSVYQRSVCDNFAATVGPGPYTILAHLPGYAVKHSSLVCMVRMLMDRFGASDSTFFLDDWSLFEQRLDRHEAPLILFGAAFGLLDLVDHTKWHLPAGSIVIETGGMKTHRQEVSRESLHARLAQGFGIDESLVWSEYGMCELMSQAYARGGSVYHSPPWMRVKVVDPQHPDRRLPDGEPGALAVIDLANMYSVSWLLTEDLGVGRGDGFEVLGRLPASALRGCNFLIPST